MNRKAKAGLTAGLMAFGALAVAAPNAQAASQYAHVELGNKCYADVYVTNDNTAGRIKGFFGVFCRPGGGLLVTPSINVSKDNKRPLSESPGPRVVSSSKGVSFAVYRNNDAGKQCYQANLLVQRMEGGDVISTKSARTACLNV